MEHQITIKAAFKIGQIVYHVTDPEQEPLLITGILIDGNSKIQYAVSGGIHRDFVYGIELCDHRNAVM